MSSDSIFSRLLEPVDALWRRIALKKGKCEKRKPGESLDEYVVKLPAPHNAIEILPGWNQVFPENFHGQSNPGGLFDDSRIDWGIALFGSLEGKRVLELGPLEGAHSYMLENAGAASILAIEANKLSYLRSLIVKELMNLKRVRFLLGDFQTWLENTDEKYDFIVASGVLYHMQDPLRLLELIASHTDTFYIWTHYVSHAAMPPEDPRWTAFLSEARTVDFHGVPVRLYRRSYHGAWRNQKFCGGTHDIHHWIEREDMLAAIRALGFDDLQVNHDNHGGPNGPSFSVFARRSLTINKS